MQPNTTPALVTPRMLRWARRRKFMSQRAVGRALSGSGVLLYWEVDLWELGGLFENIRPTVDQARKLADLYDVPLAAFYLRWPLGWWGWLLCW